MVKKHYIALLAGTIMGLFLGFLGAFLFLKIFTSYSFMDGWNALKFQGEQGKLITIGALPNLLAFFILLKFDKEMMARGIVLSMIILTIVTLFA
uniref:hypothetical protein n=1 Tax=Flavobacterium sp. TaxID=239 RepID=UPI00404A091B